MYYKSYFIHPRNELTQTEIETCSYYFEVIQSDELNCHIVLAKNGERRILWVAYYVSSFTEKVEQYHQSKYGDISKAIAEQGTNWIKITFINEGKISKVTVETYLDDGRENLVQEFDSSFELIEYRKHIYNEYNELVELKIFYADSWTIHKERMF